MQMSRPCSQRVLKGLLRPHFGVKYHRTTTTSSSSPLHYSSSSSFGAKPSGSFFSRFPASSDDHTRLLFLLRTPKFYSSSTISRLPCTIPKTGGNCYAIGAVRFLSSKSPNLGGNAGSFAKKILEKPAAAVGSAFSRYGEAVGLQIEAFFKRYKLFLLGAGGVVLCAVLWRIMFGIANTFIGFSEGMAKYGFLALSSAIVTLSGLYIRSRIIINPDRVYRMAMRRLNTSAGILEVMGAPLSGTDLRAYVMSGGGITLKKLKPSFRSRRCFLIFPIRGSERKGLVSVEVKKKKGQYDMKLLAIDVPMASGPDQRLFLVGNEEEYRIGGGLIAELRDPVVKAMAATKEFDDLDEIEEKQDEERQQQEAERKHREEVEKLENSGTQ